MQKRMIRKRRDACIFQCLLVDRHVGRAGSGRQSYREKHSAGKQDSRLFRLGKGQHAKLGFPSDMHIAHAAKKRYSYVICTNMDVIFTQMRKSNRSTRIVSGRRNRVRKSLWYMTSLQGVSGFACSARVYMES